MTEEYGEDGPEDSRQLTAAVHQLVESREREIEIKRAELEVQSKEIESNERVALASIQAQGTFHSQRFARYNAHLIHRYIFVGVMALLLCGFTLGAIYLDAGDLIMEMFKLLIPMVIGLAGGYQWGARSATKQNSDQPSNNEATEEDP